MVPFADYDMPVQYPTGIIAEHMATRRTAGLFDVSHMGRLRIQGENACAFLSHALTCDVQALVPGKAAYAFIATPTGGAVDDAYLYMLAHEDYLLVVNASNRDKDWAWLSELMLDGMTMQDQSDELGMIALQGPASQVMMESLVEATALPSNKRNQLSSCQIDGHEVIVARTGYTGEAVCFELFPRANYALELWRKLIELGATAIGLGARDSLRLEAGLPLYGHELGSHPDGTEIPVFTIPLANFAVRRSDGYVGYEAIAAQREEYQRIKRDEDDDAWQADLLTYLVQPIAIVDSKRPPRAGYQVLHDGKQVGWITSGTTVPSAAPESHDIEQTPSGKSVLCPIGLAMITSDIRFHDDHPVHLEIVDARGKTFTAKLLKRNFLAHNAQ
jgi:aminomethyltransferase